MRLGNVINRLLKNSRLSRHGWRGEFHGLKSLKFGENQKPRFLVFEMKKSREGLFRHPARSAGRFAFVCLLLLVLIPTLFISACGDDDPSASSERADDDGGGSLPPGDDDLSDDDADDDTQAGDDDDDTDDDADDDSDDDGDDDVDDDADDDADDDDLDDDADDDSDDDVDPNLTWILIPHGEFEMGCSPGDDMCDDDELPQHRVILTTDYYLSETEISQKQYTLVMEENPSWFADCDDCPVESASRDDARTFCAYVGGRLPTEAEWEYAARAGTTTRYYCGHEIDCLIDMAWYSDGEEVITEKPQPVGLKEANDFGLYDMLGNVMEYVSDWWAEDYYSTRPDPDIDPLGPENGEHVILRGGSYFDLSFEDIRVSGKDHTWEEYHVRLMGFRCAKGME